jgi:protoheme IX farnesyltransferase
VFRAYYRLTKPGIIYGNLIFATAGFLLASNGDIDFWLMAATLLSISLVIASACVFNNFIDRGIDEKMSRTKKRALVQKTIPAAVALAFASLLGLAGFLISIIFVNWLATALLLLGMVVYVGLYTIGKRRSVHGTVIGSVAGSIPPVAGYCAVTNNFDGGALLLFLVLTFWQMPHFYAIAIYRIKDYKAAGLPVLPAVKGIDATKKQIVLYITAFVAAVLCLKLFGYTGYTYLIVVGAVSLAWLRIGWQGFSAKDNEKWARSLFKFSLLVTIVFSFMLSVNAWLP